MWNSHPTTCHFRWRWCSEQCSSNAQRSVCVESAPCICMTSAWHVERAPLLAPCSLFDPDPGTAGQRHYPELGTRSPLVVVQY
jgi:hypothetical protein